jgi:hypothetical protein
MERWSLSLSFLFLLSSAFLSKLHFETRSRCCNASRKISFSSITLFLFASKFLVLHSFRSSAVKFARYFAVRFLVCSRTSCFLISAIGQSDMFRDVVIIKRDEHADSSVYNSFSTKFEAIIGDDRRSAIRRSVTENNGL